MASLFAFDRFRARTARTLADKRAQLERALTELEEMEERYRRDAADLEAENVEARGRLAEMERFASTVSHDLKIPLIAIHGFLGLLQQDALAGDVDRMKKDVERIHGAVGKMARLLDKLLELSRVGQVLNPPEEVAMGELAREAVEQVAGLVAERQVEIAIAPDLPIVFGDRPRLLEVLRNLVENAVRFMGEQPSPRIEVGFREEADHTLFSVRDNGIGVDPRRHGKIFGLFERLDRAREGAGVGLALVQRIVMPRAAGCGWSPTARGWARPSASPCRGNARRKRPRSPCRSSPAPDPWRRDGRLTSGPVSTGRTRVVGLGPGRPGTGAGRDRGSEARPGGQTSLDRSDCRRQELGRPSFG